jgi:hypothetical protein
MEQKEIDLDQLLATQNNEDVKDVASSQPISNPINIDEILTEWSFRCPKGYPTIVDGVFTEVEELQILNEILEERGFKSVDLPLEAVKIQSQIQRPSTGNDTSLKEGLVCLFYDLYKNKTLVPTFEQLHKQALDKKAVVDEKTIRTFKKQLNALYTSNNSFYGAGKSMPQNLDAYVIYTLQSKQELDTLTNAASAAQTIHQNISSQGRIIRDQTFDNIRALATKLVKEEFNITLLPDNWCPGDVYLVVNSGADKKALAAKTLNIGKDSLNAQFKRNADIVAVSLKEEKAQAGKATTFADTVFTNTFQASVSPDLKYGTSNNKDLAKLSAKISRFEDYFTGKKGGRRPQSFINAVSKDGKIHGSINTILQAVNLPTKKTTDIKFVKGEAAFYRANKTLFDDLQKAIAKIKKQIGGADSLKKTQDTFVKARKEFLQNVAKYKVEVAAEDSTKFAKAVASENEEPVSVLSKKQAAYELAMVIMSRWADKNAKISPAYKKIQAISNPFAALTAFAIAQAGVSPSFWKAVGSARNLAGGHADFFDAKMAVDIDTKTSKIQLIDSVKQAGFYLAYTTLMGKKRYSTKLVFRFSGSEIRIEVQELKESKPI